MTSKNENINTKFYKNAKGLLENAKQIAAKAGALNLKESKLIVKEKNTIDDLDWLHEKMDLIIKQKAGDPKEDKIRQKILEGRKMTVISKKADSDALANYGPRNLISRGMIPKTVIFVKNGRCASRLARDLRERLFLKGLDKYYADLAVAPYFKEMPGTQLHLIMKNFSKSDKDVKPNEKSHVRIIVAAGSPFTLITDCTIPPNVLVWGKIEPNHFGTIVAASKADLKFYIDYQQICDKQDPVKQKVYEKVSSDLQAWRFNTGNTIDEEVLNILADSSDIINENELWLELIPGVEGQVQHVKEEIEDVVGLAVECLGIRISG